MNIKQINKHTQPRIWEWVYSVSGLDARKIFLFCSVAMVDCVSQCTLRYGFIFCEKSERELYGSFYDS